MEKKLNDTQEYILSVLNSVIKATNEMNVKCYMQGGTMLGAIRHGKDTWYAFENIKLLGPEKYDQYLKSLYGDYMTPPKDADKNAHVSELVKQEEK